MPGCTASAEVEHGFRVAVWLVFPRVVSEDDGKVVLQLCLSNFVSGVDAVPLEDGLYGDINNAGIAFKGLDHPLQGGEAVSMATGAPALPAFDMHPVAALLSQAELSWITVSVDPEDGVEFRSGLAGDAALGRKRGDRQRHEWNRHQAMQDASTARIETITEMGHAVLLMGRVSFDDLGRSLGQILRGYMNETSNRADMFREIDDESRSAAGIVSWLL